MCAIAQRICATGLANLPVARQDEAFRAAVYIYITEQNLFAAQITQVEAVGCYVLWNDTSKNIFFLFRGIFAGGILGFVLGQKRWRVNYGLDPDRRPPTGLAVPYRAKDSPFPRSEFSHPEVIFLLTSLSYYYGGLSDNNLFIAFEHFLQSDQPNEEYEEWVKDMELSPAFCYFKGINVKDRSQMI